ncbi:hypothetical protein M0R89_09130 [Halorussus limi]|uniref:Uncharacterized protein n=1 Tax=Halorussus limi TaxID=2938695 RepID=A0A8U0HZ42_9EURY|nr:hypothetical protein [Halorussus limi]UPV76197.1 hypothetical protein M0R89_09130 [Halorussus limi]
MSQVETGEGEVESDPEDQDSDEEDESFQPIETTTLRDMLREESELQVGEDARDEMILKLNQLIIQMWASSVDVAKRDNRETVKARDVEDAYQQLLKPHNLLHQAISQVDEIQWRLEEVAGDSPFSTDIGEE